jgi:hypothetical protein
MKKFCLIFFLISALISSCSALMPTPVTVEVTRQVPETVVVTQLVKVVVTQIITATPQPPTPTPTATPTPLPLTTLAGEIPTLSAVVQTLLTASPTPPSAGLQLPGANAPTGEITFWCLPVDGLPLLDSYTSDIPQDAVMAQVANNQLEYVGTFKECIFTYDFKSPMPAGAELQISDTNNISPWFSTTLTPDPSNPNQGYAVLTHAMIVAPPVWTALNNFTIASPTQKVIWTSLVRYDRGWRPAICWNGFLPDPRTLTCPTQ